MTVFYQGSGQIKVHSAITEDASLPSKGDPRGLTDVADLTLLSNGLFQRI